MGAWHGESGGGEERGGGRYTDRRSMLKKIKLAGFKSIAAKEYAVELDLTDVNVVIGSNGSGKINLLSFF